MSKDKALDIVLSEFLELAKVPRPSHHEERVSEYLFQWAKRHGLAVEKDNMNEIIIDKPASPGCENVPRVIFQAHMDIISCGSGDFYRSESAGLSWYRGFSVTLGSCAVFFIVRPPYPSDRAHCSRESCCDAASRES